MQKYDWYGAYDTPLNENDVYKDSLFLDYTFDFPNIHNNVGRETKVWQDDTDADISFQIRAECLATRYRAALFNMSYFGKFWLKGAEAKV